MSGKAEFPDVAPGFPAGLEHLEDKGLPGERVMAAANLILPGKDDSAAAISTSETKLQRRAFLPLEAVVRRQRSSENPN